MRQISKKKNLFSWLFVLFGIIGLTITGNAQDESGKIELTKKATKIYETADKTNLEYGRYAKVDLSINANPYKTSQTHHGKLDIVLVFDSSNSMDENRMEAAKKAASDFIDSLMTGDSPVKMGLVEFGTEVINTQNMTTNKTTVKNFVNNIIDSPSSDTGGTNLQAAIAKANEILTNGKRADAKQVVIILTDGIPTFFTYTYQDRFNTRTRLCGTGKSDDYADEVWGENICPHKRPSEAAKEQLDALKKTHDIADVYTIVFGDHSDAVDTLAKINPEHENPLYKNYSALTGKELQERFAEIKEETAVIIGKNSTVTDIIPKEFKLTEESKQQLQAKNIKVTEQKDGSTLLTWKVGNIEADTIYKLSYIVRAEDDYHGSMATNESAQLKTTVAKDNPYYDKTKLTLDFEKPTVEIPAITKADHYLENPSYIGYSEATITGSSILTNDINKIIKQDKPNTTIKDEIVIEETENVRKNQDGTYTITKDGITQGILTMNEDGTFTFVSNKDVEGEVTFNYHIKTTITNYEETNFVYSNTSTVTLLINKRSITNIVGNKIWMDNDNQDGIRPDSVRIGLYADGIKIDETTTDANWTYRFDNLYVYQKGHENEEAYKITYTVKEEEIPTGYETTTDGYNITNSHIPETTKVKVTKVWDDKENQDGIRPTTIEVSLVANGKVQKTTTLSENNNWTYQFEDLAVYEKGQKIEYEVTETAVNKYQGVITGNSKDGFTITNSYEPVTLTITGEKIWKDNNDNDRMRPESITIRLYADGKEVATTTASNQSNWKYQFENLPKYQNGQEIYYTVTEDSVDGYETTYDKDNRFIIINVKDNEKIVLSGTKTWDDNNNQDGIRPDKITVTLTGKDGDEVVYTSSPLTVTANDQGIWSYQFDNLDKYHNGNIIQYSITEEDVEGYSSEYDGINIKNIHTPKTISITGVKTWEDNDDQDGIRPDSITILLKKTVNKETTIVTEKEVSKEDNWNFIFEDLPAYENGQEISYSLEEVSVDGYVGEIKDFTIKNTHTPETVTYKISKTWDDDNNNDGIRSDEITVRILADGKEVANAKLSNDTNWQAIFENLPKYRDQGILIHYSVVEDSVKGYQSTIQDSIEEKDNNQTILITNRHENETTSITVKKVWQDEGYEDQRPEGIVVNLYADGVLQDTIRLTAKTNWQYTFDNLLKYKNGKEIIYTIEEETVDNYITNYDGYTIINTYNAKNYIIEPTAEIIPPKTGVTTNQTNNYLVLITYLLSMIGMLSLTKKYSK